MFGVNKNESFKNHKLDIFNYPAAFRFMFIVFITSRRYILYPRRINLIASPFIRL